MCLLREDGSFPIRSFVLFEGARFPLGVVSSGSADPAFLPDREIDDFLNRVDLTVDYGPEYAPEKVRTRIVDTLECGYSLNPGFVVEGSWGMAAAVFDPAGSPRWALTLTGIESRFLPDRQQALGRLLLDEAHGLLGQQLLRARGGSASGPPLLDVGRELAAVDLELGDATLHYVAMLTIPASRPSSTTGTWRMRRSVISSARVSTESCRWQVSTTRVMMSAELASSRSGTPFVQFADDVAFGGDPDDVPQLGDDHGSDPPAVQQRDQFPHRCGRIYGRHRGSLVTQYFRDSHPVPRSEPRGGVGAPVATITRLNARGRCVNPARVTMSQQRDEQGGGVSPRLASATRSGHGIQFCRNAPQPNQRSISIHTLIRG